jgi:serine O-acetyltransferase
MICNATSLLHIINIFLSYPTILFAWSTHHRRVWHLETKNDFTWTNFHRNRQHNVQSGWVKFAIDSKEGDYDVKNDSLAAPSGRGHNNKSTYNLGVGKNPPVGRSSSSNNTTDTDVSNDKIVDASALGSLMGNDQTGKLKWKLPKPPRDPENNLVHRSHPTDENNKDRPRRVRRMVARSQESSVLRGAIWHEEHYSSDGQAETAGKRYTPVTNDLADMTGDPFPRPKFFYPKIDLSIPSSIYDPDNGTDVVWDLMRWEAYQVAQREPLLVSFLYSSILNHDTLESSLAFLLANKLSGTMISTQINSLIMGALNNDPSIGRAIRADIMAVRDRDPACTCLPDVFLYFKGFHALQTYRVAHAIWKTDKQVLAHYLQSQMSQTFQIDIHPNATLGSGIMLGESLLLGFRDLVVSFGIQSKPNDVVRSWYRDSHW